MLYKEHANGWLDENLVKDVNNYIKILKKYKLDTSVCDKLVLSVDDLLRVLHYHWVLYIPTRSSGCYLLRFPLCRLCRFSTVLAGRCKSKELRQVQRG